MSLASHLFCRARTWSARLHVSADVAEVIGRAEFVQSQSTTDRDVAKPGPS